MDFDTTGLETIRDLIRWGASRFIEAGLYFGHGTDNALDESAHLVLHALSLDHSLPGDYLNSRITPPERERVEELLRRRVEERMPAAYLTGQAWFAGLNFQVNSHVLVPRSPFAELIQNHFEPWLDAEQVGRVLDLCTGSGCIGIATALYLPHAEVDLVDISSEALAIARDNVHHYQLEDRVEVIESDLFANLQDRRYDLIVSNPPYVSDEEMAGLPAEYLAEPELGLRAGGDGLDFARKILAQAKTFLNPGGVIIVEVGNSAGALSLAFPELPLTWIEFEHGGDGVFMLRRDEL